MNLIEMLISDSYHTQRRRLHGVPPWMGPDLFIQERSDFLGEEVHKAKALVVSRAFTSSFTIIKLKALL